MTDKAIHATAWPPRVVVAAADFGEASARAVGMAGLIAAAGSGTLRVVHAERFEVPPYFTTAQIERLEDERREASAEITTELTRFVKANTTWPATIVVAEGRPVDALLEAAAEADLLVLGTSGRHGPSRWWLGSVAERVVRAAEVPVLVTPADAAPLAELFARVVLVGDGTPPDAATRARVETLAASMHGQVVASDALAACGSDVIAGATVVAVATPRRRASWGLSEVVTDALGRCAHPVLFMAAP